MPIVKQRCMATLQSCCHRHPFQAFVPCRHVARTNPSTSIMNLPAICAPNPFQSCRELPLRMLSLPFHVCWRRDPGSSCSAATSVPADKTCFAVWCETSLQCDLHSVPLLLAPQFVSENRSVARLPCPLPTFMSNSSHSFHIPKPYKVFDP